jgi:hypothetical protein
MKISLYLYKLRCYIRLLLALVMSTGIPYAYNFKQGSVVSIEVTCAYRNPWAPMLILYVSASICLWGFLELPIGIQIPYINLWA